MLKTSLLLSSRLGDSLYFFLALSLDSACCSSPLIALFLEGFSSSLSRATGLYLEPRSSDSLSKTTGLSLEPKSSDSSPESAKDVKKGSINTTIIMKTNKFAKSQVKVEKKIFKLTIIYVIS